MIITTIETGWNNPVITISQEEIDITLLEVGVQGPPGPPGPIGLQGDNLDFNDLTESQKIELRGDIGDTSIKYTNIFLNSLLN